MPQKAYEGLYKSHEACTILNCNDAELKEYVERGKIERVVPPGKLRGYYTKVSVDAFLQEIEAFKQQARQGPQKKTPERIHIQDESSAA